MKARNRRMKLLQRKNPPLKKLELPQAVLLVGRTPVDRKKLWSPGNLRVRRQS